jgi:hypothetical protein
MPSLPFITFEGSEGCVKSTLIFLACAVIGLFVAFGAFHLGNLSKAGWSWGCVSAVDCDGRTIWIIDALRGDGKRFVVHADEKLTAFLEMERSICLHLLTDQIKG